MHARVFRAEMDYARGPLTVRQKCKMLASHRSGQTLQVHAYNRYTGS